MTREEVRSVLRGVGACGESNGESACLLPPDHSGPHGYEPPPQCEVVHPEGVRCQGIKGHTDSHHARGRRFSYAWSF